MLGMEHPDTLTSVGNLAIVLQYQGKYKAAEKLHQPVLEGKEKVLGVEHPNILISVDNLALALPSQGKYEVAEEINRRVLEGCKKMLGGKYPKTLTSVTTLRIYSTLNNDKMTYLFSISELP